MANTTAHYLYDDEDVIHAPKEYIGLSNSSIQKAQRIQDENKRYVNEHAKESIDTFNNFLAKSNKK